MGWDALDSSARLGSEGWALASSENDPGLAGSATSLAECMLRSREVLLLEVLGGRANRTARAFAMRTRRKVTTMSRKPS